MTTHQHVDWFVNWTNKTLQGSIILDMVVKKEVQYVTLDTWGNNVQDVHLMPAGSAMSATLNKGIVPVADNPLAWAVRTVNPNTGQVLVIDLAQNYTTGTLISLQVLYETGSSSGGVNWLNANQTTGGNYPFMYTYSQDISGRSVAPQQDTPSNRITWGGCVTTEKIFTPFMSANFTGKYQSVYGFYKNCFYNTVKAPNYLMALVVGDLTYQSRGATTGIIAEHDVIDAAMQEFDNLQALFDTTENYV